MTAKKDYTISLYANDGLVMDCTQNELVLDVDDLIGIYMQLQAIVNGYGMEFDCLIQEEE